MEKLHVLIVDDEKDTALLFKTVLTMVGFYCQVALTAKEALARLAATVPDLLILDLRLGLEIGGEDILYQIRSNPRFDKTRIIVITAYPAIADLVKELSDLILLKPVEIEQLKALAVRLGSYELEPRNVPFRDPVTQLFNMEFFNTRVELAIERAKRRPDFLFAVTNIQIQFSDGQDEPVDSIQSTGILQGIAGRLRRGLRPTDTIARLGGWRFATLHEELRKPEDLERILERINAKLCETYALGESRYKLNAVFGKVISHPRYQTPGEILAAAWQSLEDILALQ